MTLKVFFLVRSRFLLALSLVFGSLQLLLIAIKVIFQTSSRVWFSRINQPQPLLTSSPTPQQMVQELESDDEATAIWLELLNEPDVLTNCTYHLNRCYDNDSATKRTNT